jgi:hypothetical protein
MADANIYRDVFSKELEYLDILRESGETNMFGAATYLISEFGMNKDKAQSILQFWMEDFGKGDDNEE